MKKKFNVILKSAMTLMFVLILASCGSKTPSAEDVAKKIDAQETLTQADYTAMIDYCGKYAQEAQKYFDQINAQPNDSTAAAVEATNKLADLYASYTYLDQFRTALYATSDAQLSPENEKKLNEYASYEAFPLPSGEGKALENPDVVGMIEQTPNTDSTGVISTGVGEAVDVNVK